MFKRSGLALTIAFFTFISLSQASEYVEIKSGTLVAVMLTEDVNSKSAIAGSEVSAIVTAPVIIDGKIVIEAGTSVLTTVTSSKSAGMVGQAGSLSIQVVSVNAVDGTLIPLTGSQHMTEDDETTGTVVVGVVLCPLALLHSGDNAQINANTQIRAITLGTFKIKPEA